jgi:hypothetical protein
MVSVMVALSIRPRAAAGLSQTEEGLIGSVPIHAGKPGCLIVEVCTGSGCPSQDRQTAQVTDVHERNIACCFLWLVVTWLQSGIGMGTNSNALLERNDQALTPVTEKKKNK